jgi:hypothetical protein
MRYPVTFEVKEIRGTCPLHQVGDRVTIFNGCLEGGVIGCWL